MFSMESGDASIGSIMRFGSRRAMLRMFARLGLVFIVLATSTGLTPIGGGGSPAAAADACGNSFGSAFAAPLRTQNDFVKRRDTAQAPAGALTAAPAGPFHLNVNVAAPGVLANDETGFGTDYDATLVEPPSHAQSFVLGSDGSFSYEPADGYFGPDWFTYRFTYGDLCSTVAQVTIPATPSPRMYDDVYQIPRSGLSLCKVGFEGHALCGVLLNDMNQVKEITAVMPPDGGLWPTNAAIRTIGGSVTVQPNGNFAYTPDPGFVGVDHFYYQVSGPQPLSGFGAHFQGGTHKGLAKVTLIANQVAGPASYVAVDDAYTISEDVPTSYNNEGIGGVLSNDSVPTGSPVNLTLVQGPSRARLFNLFSNGSFSYHPLRDFTGTDVFTYSIGNGVSATVTINVTPVDDPLGLTLNRACTLECDGPHSGDARSVHTGQPVQVRGTIDGLDGKDATVRVDWGDGEIQTLDYPAGGCFDCPFLSGRNWEPKDCLVESCGPADNCEFDISGGGCSVESVSFELFHDYPGTADIHSYDIGVEVISDDANSPVTGSAVATLGLPDLSLAPHCTPGGLSICEATASDLVAHAGEEVVLEGRITDHILAEGKLTVDWGDGQQTEIPLSCEAGGLCPATPHHNDCIDSPTTKGTAGCGYFSVRHVYPAPGTYAIDVEAFNSYNRSLVKSSTGATVLAPPTTTTTTSSTSTTSTSTTLAPSTTTTMGPTTTTVVTPDIPLNIDATALSDRTAVRVTGTITCEAGLRYRLQLTASQGDTEASGGVTGSCTGEQQSFRPNLRHTTGPGFEKGSATVDVTAQIGDPATGTIVDSFSTSEGVEIVIPRRSWTSFS